MSGRFFLSGIIPLFEGAAQPLSTLTFSLTGTSTAQDTYSDAGLTSANTNPVVSDANGYFGEIFLKRERYKVIWKNAAGTTLKTWDPVDKERIMTRGAGLPSDPHPGQIHDNTSDGKRYERKIGSSAWLELGTTDTVGNTASVTEQLTGTEAAKYSTPDSVAGIWQRGTDITPSAGTVSLPAGGGGVFNIAAGNFSAISSAQGGRKVLFVYGGASTITHNGTSLILQGGVSRTTKAGDISEFTNEAAADASGSNWRETNWLPTDATGTPTPDYAASQAEMEAATSLLKWVTPGRQHYHPGVAKCWGLFTVTGVVTSGHNITSIADTATGRVTVTIADDFSSADWVAVAIVDNGGVHSAYASKAAGSIELRSYNTNTQTLQDPAGHHNFVGYGDQ